MDTALFSAGNLFAGDDSDDSADSAGDCAFVERDHEFPGMILKIREFTFHQVNANLLWPGTRIFAEWLVKHPSLLSRRRILELGSGTGALTIFLRKIYDLDITTSDYDDEDIEKNIHHNHVANDVPVSPHIRHTWGDTFPSECADWDLIIASDILLYVKQYANLVKTLVFLLESWKPKAVVMEILPSGSSVVADRALQAGDHLGSNMVEEIQNDKRNNVVPVPLSLPKPCFLMSWRRRIPKDDEDLFFQGCKAVGLCVADYGARVYCIYPQSVSHEEGVKLKTWKGTGYSPCLTCTDPTHAYTNYFVESNPSLVFYLNCPASILLIWDFRTHGRVTMSYPGFTREVKYEDYGTYVTIICVSFALPFVGFDESCLGMGTPMTISGTFSSHLRRDRCDKERYVDSNVPLPYEMRTQSDFPTNNSHARLFNLSRNQCTPIQVEGTASNQSPEVKASVAKPRDETTLDRSGWDKFKSSYEQNLLLMLKYHHKGKGKNINAEKDVLSTYHDSYLYGEVPLTIKVRAAIRGWPLKYILLWLEFMAAVLSVALYIVSTYRVDRISQEKPWIRMVEVVCGGFFMVDYFIKIYSAPVRLYYVFSTKGLVDFISTIPIILSLGAQERYSGAEILLFLRALRVMPVISSAGGFTGSIKEQIFILVLYTLGVVFIAGGLLQWVEYRATPESVRQRLNCPPEGCMSFFEALYFMIVTVSTVGYGDVTLKSDWGRVVILCAIVSALVILPSQINDILHLASRRPYGGCFAVKKVVGSRFIIVSGDLSFRTIQDFLAEFYHPNHNKDMRAFPLRVVIMAPFKPSFALKSLLMYYKGKVEFIEGTPVKNSDLNRVSANVASAFYLLGDQLAQDPDAEDAAQVVRALSVHRHCGPTVRVIVELLKPERQENAIWDDMKEGIEIICPDAIRFKLLARSCHIKGLTTFLVNLFRTGLTMARPNAWMEQYCYGLRQEVFPLILPHCFHREGLLFEQVVELAYCRYGVILFGLDIATVDCDSNLSREILLCPIGRLIQGTDVGLVIAKNLETAELLSKFGKFTTDSNMGDEKMTCFPHTQSKLCGPKLSSKASEEALLLQTVKSASGRGGSRDVEAASHVAESTPTRAKLAQCARFVHPRNHQANGLCIPTVDSHSIEAVTDETILANAPPHSSSKWGSHSDNSLEEAVDIAMSWPPVVKCTKPEQPVLERQTRKIFENLAERTLQMVKLQDSHILLCIQGTWPVSLFYFIEQLRKPIVPNPPIVILHPNDPKASDWGCVGLFEHVYFVKGSPIYELDLVRAGVLQAEKVVILSQGKQLEQPSLEIANDRDRFHPAQTFSLDVNNLIIAATVERLSVQSSRVIVELQQEAEIQYLRPKLRFDGQCFYPGMYRRNQAAKFQFSPSYIEGKGFCPATLGFLMYCTFYNRHTVAIVEQLISGSVSAQMGEDNSNTIKHKDVRKLDQIHVPKRYVGQTFIEMFVGLLREEGTIALGLYRDRGTNGSLISFVYTNPQPDTPLLRCDLVYILH